MRVFKDLDEFAAAAGADIGVSEWVTIDQQRIDDFAKATGDFQWIHVDPQRAADGPFGGTIAHGYLTLSLLPLLATSVYRIEGVRMGINYGSDRIRFASPVSVDSRVRLRSHLIGVKQTSKGSRSHLRSTIEIEGSDKPACIAETIILHVA